MILCSVLVGRVNEIQDFVPFNVAILDEIFEDWVASPFVDIKIAGDGEVCPDQYIPIFNATWLGLQEGCLLSDDTVMTKEDFDQ